MPFKPYTEVRTGKRINTIEEEIAGVYALSHNPPEHTVKVQTQYGLWILSDCPYCGEPIDNWYHKHCCGNCGVILNWKKISGEQ